MAVKVMNSDLMTVVVIRNAYLNACELLRVIINNFIKLIAVIGTFFVISRISIG